MSSEKPRHMGKVKWFNAAKGFGFIILMKPGSNGEEGEQLFAHQTAIQVDGFRTLEEQSWVSFVIEQTGKGLQAVDIRIEKGPPASFDAPVGHDMGSAH